MIILCCCARCTDHTVPLFNNTTVVDNYTTGPATIAPYTRPWFVAADAACGDPTCDEADEPVCALRGFDGSTDLEAGITPGGSVTVDLNGYEDAATTTTISNPCYGWKAVAARAIWPGRFGFINSARDSALECCDGQQQSKYTSVTTTETVRRSFLRTVTNECDSSPNSTFETFYESVISQTASVDSYGNVTRSGSVSVTIWTEVNGVRDGVEVLGSEDISLATGSATYAPPARVPLDAVCGIISFGQSSATGFQVPLVTGTLTEVNAENLFPPPANDAGVDCSEVGWVPGDGLTPTIVSTGSGAVFTLSDSEIDVEWDWASTSTQNACCETDPVAQPRTVVDVDTVYYHQNVTLGGGYGYGTVKADAKAMLAEWDLGDDAQYPWRYDSSTWLVPFLSRDAFPTIPTINWTQDGSYDFLNEGSYTGDVRGIPNPAGYARHFNFHHNVWTASDNIDGSVCTACIGSLGELSASPLPATATQWTEKVPGANMHGPGGWMTNRIQGMYGATGSWPDSFDDGVTMQKWAETIESWPSLNYARPCARDRYLFDEQAIACVESFSAPDLVIEAVPLSGPTEFEVGDVIAIATEVYQVASKADAQTYTVGAKLYDLLISCDGASKLRFPAARAICGELDVDDAVQTSPGVVTITLLEKHWFKRNGSSSDTVNFTGVAGLGSGLTATVVDDYSFTVPGTLGAWTSGGTVSQTGDQTAWDTTCPRRKYVTREWQSRLREWDTEDPEDLPYTLTETERSYTYSASNPYVVVISPNTGDTPTRGVRYDFGDIDADMCFGAEWHMDVSQAMADPFWQADHVPCGWGGGAWDQDSAPCAGDGDYEYPPLVESMLSAPSGAPTLPLATPTGYPTGETGSPGPVSHSNCEVTPYARGTVHAVRAAWEACEEWIEKTMHRCG